MSAKKWNNIHGKIMMPRKVEFCCKSVKKRSYVCCIYSRVCIPFYLESSFILIVFWWMILSVMSPFYFDFKQTYMTIKLFPDDEKDTCVEWLQRHFTQPYVLWRSIYLCYFILANVFVPQTSSEVWGVLLQ